MPEKEDSPMRLNMSLGPVSVAVGRNSPGKAQEKQAGQWLLFSVTPAPRMGLMATKSCHRGRHQQHSGTSHTLLGHQYKDQDHKLQAEASAPHEISEGEPSRRQSTFTSAR